MQHFVACSLLWYPQGNKKETKRTCVDRTRCIRTKGNNRQNHKKEDGIMSHNLKPRAARRRQLIKHRSLMLENSNRNGEMASNQ